MLCRGGVGRVGLTKRFGKGSGGGLGLTEGFGREIWEATRAWKPIGVDALGEVGIGEIMRKYSEK